MRMRKKYVGKYYGALEALFMRLFWLSVREFVGDLPFMKNKKKKEMWIWPYVEAYEYV